MIQIDRSGRLRILMSYHYYGHANFDEAIPRHFRPPYPEIFLDSGAFSAFTLGVDLDIDDYIDFIQRNRQWISVYANLDDIGSAETTWRNQQIMETAGLKPLPVFHAGSPWSHLERYVERYTYIALGRIIPYNRTLATIIPWLTRCFRMAKGRAVYHGFGATNWNLLSMFPWYSADSTTWTAAWRYGRINAFDDRHGRFVRVYLNSPKSRHKHARLLRRYGLDTTEAGTIAALSYMAAESWLRTHRGTVTMNTRPGALTPCYSGREGPRIYLAAGMFADLSRTDAGLKTYLGMGAT